MKGAVNDFLGNSMFFGIFISIAGYELGLLMKRKWKFAIFNPLLIGSILTISVMLLFDVKVEDYNKSGNYLSYLITPATVCLAVPLYKQIEILKKNAIAIIFGIIAGVLSSMGSVLGLCMIFKFTHEQYVTLLPKSITTPIGIAVSEELGGYATITAAIIIITGIIGNVLAETLCRLFRLVEPVAKGIAIGSCSHALGTVKAIEIGEIEGAMSSLSIAFSGLVTAVSASFFAMLY